MWLEAEVSLQRLGICKGHRHITGLHGHQFLVRLEIIVRRQHTSTNQFLRQNLHKVQQVFGVGIADVVNCIGGNGQTIFAVLLFRSLCHHTYNAFHDVIHIGKVPLAVSVVENLDGFAVHQLIGKAEICHVRTTGRTIHGEEAQTCRGDIVEFGVSVCHQLIGLLGSRIQGNRVVHLVISGVGHLLIAAVLR